MTSVNDIRKTFLEYFVKNGHAAVESSPLVPRNDPSLMFANSGMVQFKNIFTGAETRPYKRATTAQKCVRAGGKHNDLENVGYTARHHTFFEMLGNFSFGDYFKEQAIHHAWTMVTREFALPADKLCVTVYHDDDEAISHWKKIAGLSDSKIIRINTNDNFWQMGDTGPCGPCSEIFYDHGDKIWGGPPGSPTADGDRFIEIWNLVFMQFEQFVDKPRLSLPKPSIDTGMGLERIAAVLQGKHNNYDIDLMRAIIMAIADHTNQDPDGPLSASFKVISDHLRAGAFLIADGVTPSNEGRGYVLRRILRRGMRHAHLLGCTEPLFNKILPALINQMGGHYGELVRAEAMIRQSFQLEEERFLDMLARGLKLLEKETSKLGEGEALSGQTAFNLYDTFGFPLDLTADILRGQNRNVDINGFNNAMAEQKARARKAWAGSGENKTAPIWLDIYSDHGASEFFGYNTIMAEGVIGAIVVDNKQLIHNLPTEANGAIILNQTPFYGESGGQQGDKGIIKTANAEFLVTDTQKFHGVIVHYGRVTKGELKTGSAVQCLVDKTRRDNLRAHHSATHLLHQALRDILGDHVAQKGSLVAEDFLRFDFSHNQPITPEQLADITQKVNLKICANKPVETHVMNQESAIKAGALALFGEKYGDEVRVLFMGEPDNDDKKYYSVELCGGTHVRATGDIGFFKILSQESVAAGVRRITGQVGINAVKTAQNERNQLNDLANLLKCADGELVARVGQLINDRKKLEKDVANMKLQGGGQNINSQAGNLANVPNEHLGITIIAQEFQGFNAKELMARADIIKANHDHALLALASQDETGKISFVITAKGKAGEQYDCGKLARECAAAIGGSGGGRRDMAQGGGSGGQIINVMHKLNDLL